MAKRETDARTRLQLAALELFNERGYERTTAAEIAARAGVTERTFFRQFPDKREVLFGGEAILREALTAAIAVAPDGNGPMAMLFHAFRSVVPLLEANRPFSEPRQVVIAATPALQERETTKMVALADSLATALQRRGIAPLPATLAARTGMTAFALATIAWLENPVTPLAEWIDLTLHELGLLLATGA